MTANGIVLIAFGGILLLLALVLGFRRRQARLRNVRGNVIIGDVEGPATQTYTATGESQSSEANRIGVRDIANWVIGLLGVAVAAAGVYLQNFAP